MWMSVLKAQIAVIIMQLATTLMEVTPAFATLDTQAMDFRVQVSAGVFYDYGVFSVYTCKEISHEWKLCSTQSCTFSAASD